MLEYLPGILFGALFFGPAIVVAINDHFSTKGMTEDERSEYYRAQARTFYGP